MSENCALPAILGVLAALALSVVMRLVRRQSKAPVPAFLARVIDHPLRRLFQLLETTPQRHGVAHGMRVLEIGPGNGSYTLATARHVGPEGLVVALDIEPKLAARLGRRAHVSSVANLQLGVADAQRLPLAGETFDAAYMMMVLGEIPEPEQALRECMRILRPQGVLALSEMLPDPDYASASSRIQLVESTGFRLLDRAGNTFYYTLRFEKPRGNAINRRVSSPLGV